MKTVAITGNIASGKSTVEKLLIKDRFKVFDCDKFAHEILENSQEIVNCFKNYDIMTDKKIDRKKLGKIVFENKELLKKLENIIHPQVKQKIFEIFENNSKEKYVFVSVPQLFEAGFENMFDIILYIKTDENIRLQRLMQRNDLSEDEAKKRIKAQMSDEIKISKSNYVIENNFDLTFLKSEYAKFIEWLNIY